MPNVKIINVQKGDTFDEIFNTFKTTQAQEVIFIFPRGSKFSHNEEYISLIGEEAIKLGKVISIMSSDPIIAKLATAYGISLLGDRKATPTQKLTPIATMSVAETENEEEKFEENEDRNILSDEDIEENEKPVAELAVVKTQKKSLNNKKAIVQQGEGKIIRDIITLEDNSVVKIKTLKPKVEKVEVTAEVNDEEEDMNADDALDSFYDKKEESEDKENQEIQEEINEIEETKVSNDADFKFKNRDLGENKEEDQDSLNIERLWSDEETKQREQGSIKDNRRRSSRIFANVFSKTHAIILGIAIIVLIVIVLSVFVKANVIINPQKQELDFTLQVSASTATTAVNTQSNRIPGQLFATSKTITQEFDATGQKEVAQKARGEITISNQSRSSQSLVATTRFQSKNGLIFRTPDSIIVPAGTESNPGTINITVFADKPGPDFNIEASTFTVPGFNGSDLFQQLTASSTKAMTGGAIGPSSIVTVDDYSKSVATVRNAVQSAVLQELQTQAGELTVIQSTNINFSETQSNVSIGEAADSLKITLIGSASVLAFRQTDILELISQYVSDTGNLEIKESKLIISYENPILTDQDNILTFDVRVTGFAGAHIDSSSIKRDIAGMDIPTVVKYFENIDQIESVNITLSPKWARRIPRDLERIYIFDSFLSD